MLRLHANAGHKTIRKCTIDNFIEIKSDLER